MSQIFLSYSSRDRALAVQVASRLAEGGLSIWYDDALQTGTAYRSAIRRAIDGAHVVCVLWTAAAARSAWVNDEAGTGSRRGTLFSVACGKAPVPGAFRGSVFGRIRRPEHGPTPSEVANLVRGLSHMLAASPAEDRFSVKSLVSRLADFISSSVIFGVLTAALILSMTASSKAPIVSGPLVLAVVSAVVGLSLGGVGFASSRLCDHLAVRYLSTNVGPSVGRLMYRWCGEAAGCAIPLILATVFKGRTAFFAVTAVPFVWHLVAAFLLAWLLLMGALAVKYVIFIACTRCRYLLLT